MKKANFFDALNQTQDIISGRMTQYRKPLRMEGVERLEQMIKKQGIGYEDGTLTRVPDHFVGFVKRFSPWQIDDILAVQETYQQVWRSTGDNDYRRLHEYDMGWTNKIRTSAEFLPHRIKVTRMKLERLQDITEDDAIASGIVPCQDHVTGNGIGYWHEGLNTRTYPTAKDAFIALFHKEHGDMWGDNPWCWVYDLELTTVTV